ncbi:hypothetical protein ACQPXB_28105 [Amycolatopsis sp. CA-161197]|uniref:hypothetical protein n=1 Tax=Amycolatopsis sp. CA-161197 TaxID=3239922 RepID=UPI003D8F20E9
MPAATGAHAHRLSDGKIDRAALHCPERAFVTALRVPDGDNRDWPMIKAWGRENAAELIALPSGLLVALISLAWFGRRAPAS